MAEDFVAKDLKDPLVKNSCAPSSIASRSLPPPARKEQKVFPKKSESLIVDSVPPLGRCFRPVVFADQHCFILGDLKYQECRHHAVEKVATASPKQQTKKPHDDVQISNKEEDILEDEEVSTILSSTLALDSNKKDEWLYANMRRTGAQNVPLVSSSPVGRCESKKTSAESDVQTSEIKSSDNCFAVCRHKDWVARNYFEIGGNVKGVQPLAPTAEICFQKGLGSFVSEHNVHASDSSSANKYFNVTGAIPKSTVPKKLKVKRRKKQP